MTISLGLKALLGWVKSIKLSEKTSTLDDLKDGAVLLEVVCLLKKEPNSCFCKSVEERFKVIADFVESEFINVLLLLVYHDIMNDRLTLDTLDCDVEREIAHLTGSFVMENDGCVYLSKGLDAYLARKHLPVAREIFERSASVSTSGASTASSFSDDDSPVFRRAQKVSKSPLQEIMNTPKFQLRKMQRQVMKERDYRDGLERELAGKLALIAQRESHINQLQYRLDKMKEEQGDQESVIREQLNELQSQNDMLHIRLNEMVKQNKDFKSNSSLMERKVDELSDENGVLSSQVTTR
ncbi:Nuclear mitotic apparatus protein 1 [Liparis tanakae]|uniref:Nuclear mitotic apparatus protein 1 n=1 Tax=Liparis tanakae TaxID=230148 RepID=A0A4Z2F0U8_9TELE|nr:Nuclear mitotic apparatus protein 1 [Liparis tanakae]